MDNLLFEVVKIVVMAVAAFAVTHIIPFLKAKIGNEKISTMEIWARNAVMYAQQWMEASTGEEKKALVTHFLTDMRNKYKVDMTDEQLEILIESAVKEMKLKADYGILINADKIVE